MQWGDLLTMVDLARIKDFLLENGGVLAPGAVLEEEAYIPEEIERTEETTNVEPVSSIAVSSDLSSELRFFEDGIQRTLYVGHLVANGYHIPVHYCTVAAAILERTDRHFHLADNLFVKRELLLVSRANVPDQSSLDALGDFGIEVIDTEVAGRNFNELCRKAQNKSKSERLAVESKLVERWAEHYNGNSFLLVDGTVMNLRSDRAVSRCVGVSKQVLERHFALQNHKRVYNLKFGERSWVFRFNSEDDDPRLGARDRLSWYLRIRDTTGRHPEFGLLRCEVSTAHVKRATKIADRLSASLMAERYPIAFPDARWDRLLYPIRQCEQYLRSRCRPLSSVQAAFGRTQRI